MTLVYLVVGPAAAATARAQVPVALHASASSRATTEIRLTYPTAAPMMSMANGAPTTTPSATPKSDSAPAAPATPGSSTMPFVIALEYGQPHLRGRALHVDSLVPYDKPWRTGANGPTTLSTDVELELGGTVLPKGKYVLYTIPSRAGWKLIVQKSAGQSGMTFDAANDLARIDLRLAPLAAPIESLTMWLIPSTDPGPAHGELRIAWGTEQLSTNWLVKDAP